MNLSLKSPSFEFVISIVFIYFSMTWKIFLFGLVDLRNIQFSTWLFTSVIRLKKKKNPPKHVFSDVF